MEEHFRNGIGLPDCPLVGSNTGHVKTVAGPVLVDEVDITLMLDHTLSDAVCNAGKREPASRKVVFQQPSDVENSGEVRLEPIVNRDCAKLADLDAAVGDAARANRHGGTRTVETTTSGLRQHARGDFAASVVEPGCRS